jgi:ribosome assembly protein YihI (activator of Der GTPase)
MNLDDERLINLSIEELEALANSSLVPTTQTQLNELLEKNTNNKISDEEQIILDKLLNQIDNLNLLKTRAKYTLSCLKTVR